MRPEQAKGQAARRRCTRAQRDPRRAREHGRRPRAYASGLVDQERIVPVSGAGTGAPAMRTWGAALQHVQEAGVPPRSQVRWCVIGDRAKWIWIRSKPSVPPPCRSWPPTITAASMCTPWHACRVVMTQCRHRRGGKPRWLAGAGGMCTGRSQGGQALQPRETPGRRGHQQADRRSAEECGAAARPLGPQGRRSQREWGHRVGQHVYQSCTVAIARGAWWYAGEGQPHAGPALCHQTTAPLSHSFAAYNREDSSEAWRGILRKNYVMHPSPPE